MTGQPGIVYLLHFDRPYQHARHYTGWTGDDVLDRIERHATGRGARLMTVIHQAGIGFILARLCEGTRDTERAIKNSGGAVRYCPLCTSRPWNGHWGPVPDGSHPPLLPLPPRRAGLHLPHRSRRKAVTAMTSTRTRGKRDDTVLPRQVHRQGAPQRGGHRLAVAHRTTHPRRPAGRSYLADPPGHHHWAAVVLAAAIGIIFAVPWSRRFITRRFWCVLARHRFHRLCWEARLHTRAGRLPVVLWTRPTKVGERLTVWCRAGICADDFIAHSGELAAACYAREARVTRNTSWSQIVTVNIIRRDTLAARHKVGTPLSRLMDTYAAVPGRRANSPGRHRPGQRPGPMAAAN